MNNQELAKKTESIFVSQCWHRGYASPVQVLLDLGYLSKKDYESWRKGSVPYLVRVRSSGLDYRKGPGESYDSWGFINPGVYTIVEEKDGWGLLKAYAKERNGWLCLADAERA